MNKRNTLKVIGIFALAAVLTSSFVGCGSNSADEDSSEKAETTTTAETSAAVTETQISETNTEPESSLPEETESEPPAEAAEPVIADLSFLNGSPNKIEIFSRKLNINTQEAASENDPAFYEADIDVLDSGSGYLLGISSVKYYLGVANYRDFLDNAIDHEAFTIDENGKRVHEIKDGSNVLTCCGEKFTLVNYTVNDMGRGNCEFVGADGETYYLYNDMSSYIDTFTGMTYFKLTTEDGQEICRELEFDEGTYIEIPYGIAEGTGLKSFVSGSPDENSGNPAGNYSMQLDSDGNIVQFQGW